MSVTESFQPVNFEDVRVGDSIRFVTNDNGYGGRGFYSRTGTVIAAGPKSVTLKCDDGTTARLRSTDWSAREPQKAVDTETARTPYDAEHVAIVDMGHTVWALYIPDPEQARDPRAVADNILDRKYEDVEVIATAQRYYKRDGADLSGWVVSGNNNSSEPYPNKRGALFSLRHLIRSCFARIEQETEAVINIETVPATGCRTHHVDDRRGTHAGAIVVPRCESGARYGVWDENDAGFVHVVDCAQDAANWAAAQLDEDPDQGMGIKAVCPDHEDQPGYGCEECNAEGCGALDAGDLDACGQCRDCNPRDFD